ncbi:MAG TPA: glycosyltransferase [Casimicrobiaceae bacterium]|nr:glycosyltransferase [Casimicrobiaceae bacterium]
MRPHPAPLSVCVPTFNGSRFLAPCLESILGQTFADFELIVVDDVSSDDTLDTVNAFARRDSRIRVERNDTNLGLVGNWRRSVELALAPYVKFVFQDDVIAPTCIEALMSAADSGHALIFCARDFSFVDGVSSESRDAYEKNRRIIAEVYGEWGAITAERFCDATLDHMTMNLVGEPTVALLHRSVFDDFGWFNGDLLSLCDAEFWARIGVNRGVYHVKETLATFRVHASAASAIHNARHEYRARVIDRLLFRHEVAFSPAYAPLRDVASKRSPPIDLVADFWESVHWARREATQVRPSAPSPLDEWREVSRTYSRLGSIPLKYRLRRISRSIARRASRSAGA